MPATWHSPPAASNSIFSMERGPRVVLMMSATAWQWKHRERSANRGVWMKKAWKQFGSSLKILDSNGSPRNGDCGSAACVNAKSVQWKRCAASAHLGRRDVPQLGFPPRLPLRGCICSTPRERPGNISRRAQRQQQRRGHALAWLLIQELRESASQAHLWGRFA